MYQLLILINDQEKLIPQETFNHALNTAEIFKKQGARKLEIFKNKQLIASLRCFN